MHFLRGIFILSFCVSILVSFQGLAHNSSATANGSLNDSIVAAKVHALHDYVKTSKKLIDYIDLTKADSLPLGISKVIGGKEYLIVIERITLTPQGGLVTASMSFELPNGNRIAFRGSDIKIAGGGIQGVGTIKLVSDHPVMLSEQMQLNLIGREGKTYVNFGCEGFQSFGIQAELEFSRDLILPEREDGSIDYESRVKAGFEIPYMAEWGDLIAKINLPPFQIRGLNGFGFHVKDAIFDFSELSSSSSVQYPNGYSSINPDANTAYWQGVYIRDVAVRLPQQFKSSDQQRVEFGAAHLIIDDKGFTGDIRALNLLGIDKGNIGGWPFSIDSIGVSIKANQLTGGGIAGRMLAPIIHKDEPIAYKALINTGGNYLFSVSLTGNKKIPLWSADAELYPGSTIQMRITEKEFYPKLILHGNLTIAGNNSDVSLSNIEFQDLHVQSIKPYVTVRAFSLGSDKGQQKVSNFPVTLKEVGLSSYGNDLGISVGLAVNLVGESDGGFSAEGYLTVWGEQKETDWQFKSVDLSALIIDVDGGAFKLKGGLNFYKNDSIFGKGFRGSLMAEFTPGLKVQATAQFGSKEYRYWYADAMASFPSGIQVAPAFGLYGFGGGAYFRMKQVNFEKVKAKPVSNGNDLASLATESSSTQSGIMYVPDANTGLGIKASVVVGTYPTPNPFNGDATFEISFNQGGGINFISFSGNAFFMTELTKRNSNAAMYANLKIEYDVPNKSLFGNLNVFVNVAGAIHGTGGNNLAGSAVIYFSPDDWHIHIGTPDSRVGLKLMNIVSANGYFMVGTSMPDMPAPPANVTSILGGDFNFMRDENALADGGGFAFGASIQVTTGDLTFLVFYARLDAGAGFDLMLKNYGSGVRCSGRSEPLGINGYYASGQAYAYIQGKVGIKVDLSFVKGSFDILDIGAAAVLQAKLPNPFWMRGTVGGYYSILGGLIKGNCRFEATIGEQCQMENGGSLVANMKIIAETSPSKDSKKVSVFNLPQAAFNMEIGKVFELTELDDTKKSFRIVLDHFKLSTDGKEIPANYKWNTTNDVLAVQPVDIFPANKQIRLFVKVHFEELKNGNWVPVISNGKVVEEIAESVFETGDAPTEIPHSNVAYSYPVINQQHFYKDEYGKGYIQLKQGQDDLFEGNGYSQKARIETADKKLDFDFTYDAQANKVMFDLPASLSNSTDYTFSLINIPLNATVSVDKNVNTLTENKLSVDSVSVDIVTKDIEGNLDMLQESPFYTASFRTSRFSQFEQKLNAMNISHVWTRPVLNVVDEIGVNITGDERFDIFETEGVNGVRPLIQYEISLDNRWYKNDIQPLVYKDYPYNSSMTIDWRNPDSLGVPPVGAVWLGNKSIDREKVSQDFYGTTPEMSFDYTEVVYAFPYFCYEDLENLRLKARINYSRTLSEEYYRLTTGTFVNITPGKYKLKIRYVLPGTSIITSEKEVSFVNP